MGLLGNLSAAQVVEQVVEARRWLAQYQQQQQQQQQEEKGVGWLLSQQQQEQQEEGSGERGGAGGAVSAHHQQQEKEEEEELLLKLGNQARAANSGSSSVSASHVSQEASTSGSSSSSSSSSSRKQQRGGKWPVAPPRISNIVFMGMGEPLHNMEAVMPALDILADTNGLSLSRSKIIVSTVGLVPQLKELRASGKAKLAVSLHATTDEVGGGEMSIWGRWGGLHASTDDGGEGGFRRRVLFGWVKGVLGGGSIGASLGVRVPLDVVDRGRLGGESTCYYR